MFFVKAKFLRMSIHKLGVRFSKKINETLPRILKISYFSKKKLFVCEDFDRFDRRQIFKNETFPEERRQSYKEVT
jgi:hypothetical protein